MLKEAYKELSPILSKLNQKGKPAFEIHTWEQLSPFYNIVKMLDLMNLAIEIILISIGLISILNVMVMSVYERIAEIGTIAAMGTPPKTIVKLFLTEGLYLGVLGAVLGSIISVVIVWVLNTMQISYSFGRQDNLVLEPSLAYGDIIFVGVVVVFIYL